MSEDAKTKAVERLAWLLHASDAEANPDWVFDEWPIEEWAKLSEDDRAEARALAVRIMQVAGLVAVPAELVEAIRAARLLPDNGSTTNEALHALTMRAKATYALADAVMDQIGGKP